MTAALRWSLAIFASIALFSGTTAAQAEKTQVDHSKMMHSSKHSKAKKQAPKKVAQQAKKKVATRPAKKHLQHGGHM